MPGLTIRGAAAGLYAVLTLAAVEVGAVAPPGAAVFVNEFHYDNTGTDTGEAIEVAGPAGTDLTGWSLVLYNGSGGALYDTTALSGTIPDLGGGFGVVVTNYPSNGIQNGSPDGIALVDDSNAVVQFLSYEGSFTAVDGPAAGMASTDIGVFEPGDAPVGESLQLTGTGTTAGDFTWAGPVSNTLGAFNAGQTFGGSPPAMPKLNEFSASTVGTDVEYVEVYGAPSTDYSAYTILEIEGDFSGTATGTIDEVIAVGSTAANGLWLGNLPANALENGTITLLLVRDFTGALNTDLDTDDDGTFDLTPWSAIIDAVAVNDGGSSDLTYGVPVLGPNYDGVSSFAPGGASRMPDGFDTNAASDWVRNDFDLAGIPGFTGTIEAGEAYNTPGDPNAVYEPPGGACGDPAVFVHQIQSTGLTYDLAYGGVQSVEAVVTAVTPGLGGFYVQEEDADQDADPLTSEGIFVYLGGVPSVAVGDAVRVTGTVGEYVTSGGASSQTQLAGAPIVTPCGTDALPTATDVTFPLADPADLEAVEGMLVGLPQELVISEYFNFDRFGEVVVSLPPDGWDRLYTPTAVVEPGLDAVDLAAEYATRRITIDDGRSAQNPDPAIHPGNGMEFTLDNRFRGGDTVAGTVGVVDHTFGLYRLHPTAYGAYTAVNPRPDIPDDVGGNLWVASMNLLNYFLTLDNGGPICGPLQDQECRGADDAIEFERQRSKILSALTGIDGDVVGLIEVENTAGVEPAADLVAGLNDIVGAGTYDYVDTGVIGTDPIRVGLIYKPAAVQPVGDFAILDSSVDPLFLDTKNRPVLAQAFEAPGGRRFTVAVSHLKSKGSACDDVGDPDLGDGAGNCNLTRTDAVEALVDWLATDPTGSGTTDALIVGDLNSYDMEDPIDVLLDGGYTDLLAQFVGETAYGYLFDDQFGYLAYALASSGLANAVTGATAWHINADEPDILDYDMSFKQDAQDALYEPNAFRSSDHDPVIVGLDLADDESPTIEVSVTPNVLWPANHKYVDVEATVTVADDSDPAPTFALVSVTSNEPDNGDEDGNTVDDIVIVDQTHFRLRAERSGLGTGRVYTITYGATDAAGNTAIGTATVTVPLRQGRKR